MKKIWSGAALLLSASAFAAPLQIKIDASNPKASLTPHLYGLFFEDINYAADGGIYAELIQNRSFEYYSTRGNDRLSESLHPLYAWESVERDGASCSLKVENINPLNTKNTHYLKLDISDSGEAGVLNTGFDGIPINEGDKYDISFYARNADWSSSSRITVALELEDGSSCGKETFSGIGNSWKKFEGVIRATETADNARLVITVPGKGTLYLDMVSLFPQDTFMGRKNGMRKDLAQAIKELNPKFLRFPGGCIAHGDGLENVYRWKDTVGDVAERKPNWNRWGYHQTYGLGYFEYFQLSEDLGATALPVIPVGVSCGFTPPQECVPIEDIGPWIQDALDLIEFANGPIDSEWGGLRARMGHPKPFNLQYVALGNEPHDNALFRDRFPLFTKAIREAYPDIKIIGTSGLDSAIPIYDLMTKEKVYSSDEHYYKPPQWFIDNQNRFDDFDRSKPKIFVGEYASENTTLFNAVAEAAYLTGVERNGDMVDMTCYAPLFANVKHTQWATDMIYFDHRTIVKTPSYYVQQLFASYKGDVYVANEVTQPELELPTLSGGVGVGSWHTTIEVADLAVNGKKLDPAQWRTSQGNFKSSGSNYVQLDVNAEPALSQSSQTFNGKTVTYTLRARKTSGNEGFLIVIGNQADRSSYWWNIGGWDNTRHALQFGVGNNKSVVTETNGSIESNRWYDITVVMSSGNIKCYLDGNLIHNYDMQPPSISISTTRDYAAGEVIVKLVNPTTDAIDADIKLLGVTQINPKAELICLTGDSDAKNSIENPDVIKPETSTITVGPQFKQTLPPCSVQFIRIKAK